MDKGAARSFITKYPTWEVYLTTINTRKKAGEKKGAAITAAEDLGAVVGEELGGLVWFVQKADHNLTGPHEYHLFKLYRQVEAAAR